MKRDIPRALITAGVHVDQHPDDPDDAVEVIAGGRSRVMTAEAAHRLTKRQARHDKAAQKTKGSRAERRVARQQLQQHEENET